MHVVWKVTLLLVTHVGLLVLCALVAVEWRMEAGRRAAYADPWYRVGLQLTAWGEVPPDGLPPVAEDLAVVESQLPPDVRAIVSLIASLQGLDNGGGLDMQGAQLACGKLRWNRCEPTELRRLRERLVRGMR